MRKTETVLNRLLEQGRRFKRFDGFVEQLAENAIDHRIFSVIHLNGVADVVCRIGEMAYSVFGDIHIQNIFPVAPQLTRNIEIGFGTGIDIPPILQDFGALQHLVVGLDQPSTDDLDVPFAVYQGVDLFNSQHQQGFRLN